MTATMTRSTKANRARKRRRKPPCLIVGTIEIAERLHVPVKTVHQWIFREVLPPADYPEVNGGRAWYWDTVLAWAGETGRLFRAPELVKEYRELTGLDPEPASPAAQKAAARGGS